MASNFIPMLSSSPPPLDDCQDNEDEDEEFGNFTTAGVQFDSSFDSPVSGEKYKPFKTGENGVNDISMKNDLNAFCSYSNSPLPPAKDLVLSLSPHNQSNHKNLSPNESKNEDELILDSSGKLAFPQRLSSSKEKLSIDKASQNCVPESSCTVQNSIENCHESCNEDVWVRQDGFNCSNEVNCTQAEPDCDGLKDSSSEPPFEDESGVTEDFESVHIPTGDISYYFQSTDSEALSSREPSVDAVECRSKESYPQNVYQDRVADSVAKDSERFVADFPVDFPDSSSFDEFDDFQDANASNNTFLENGDSISKDGIVSNHDGEFEAHFDDITLENKGSCDAEGFGAFQTNVSSDADEFDDFQGFDKTATVPSFQGKVNSCEHSENEDNDMCNFRGAPEVESEDFDDFQGCSSEQGFANFDSESVDDKAQSGSPEFADFEQASFSSLSSETIPSSSCLPSSATIVQDKGVDKISTVINAIFPPLEEPNDVDVTCDPSSEVLEQSNKSRRLWEKLHEVEQTPGLRFQWGVSHSFQQLLRSVNVDYHSILRTSSVPIFASGLSLLEPVKGQTNSANPESDDRNQSPRDPIPPVEFDWNTSGLINPLDSVQSVSTLMDLSFLSTSDTGTSSVTRDHSFENEFLKPSPVPACSENSSKTFILEELLSKNVCSIPNSNITHRPADLTEEANCVLDQLPDLSYMRAKVLMFPISSKT